MTRLRVRAGGHQCNMTRRCPAAANATMSAADDMVAQCSRTLKNVLYIPSPCYGHKLLLAWTRSTLSHDSGGKHVC